MAAYKGLEGDLKIGSVKVAQTDTWELYGSADMNEVSSFGTRNKTYQSGLRNASATISGRLDVEKTGPTNDILDNMSNAAKLAYVVANLVISTEADRAAHWYGRAIVSNVSIGSKVGDMASFSASLQFDNGAVYATNTST